MIPDFFISFPRRNREERNGWKSDPQGVLWAEFIPLLFFLGLGFDDAIESEPILDITSIAGIIPFPIDSWKICWFHCVYMYICIRIRRLYLCKTGIYVPDGGARSCGNTNILGVETRSRGSRIGFVPFGALRISRLRALKSGQGFPGRNTLLQALFSHLNIAKFILNFFFFFVRRIQRRIYCEKKRNFTCAKKKKDCGRFISQTSSLDSNEPAIYLPSRSTWLV